MIDTLESVVRRNPSMVALARTAGQAEKIVGEGKIAAVIGVEGGHMIDNRLDYVDSLYQRGMCYLTLTWTGTDWATSSQEEAKHGDSLLHKGLTSLGEDVVRRLNALGVMIDVSHAGEQTFWDVMKLATAPVIASHSCVYALNPHYRNLKDDQIRAIAEKNGVVCINFYSGFLDSTYDRRSAELRSHYKGTIDSIRAIHRGDHLASGILDSMLGPEYQALRPPLSLLVDHIDYVVKLVGIDYVGIGSDFDGIESLPVGLNDASCMPLLTRELVQRGYKEEEIRKILGGNFLRVFHAVCR
jgi:membrane dipeptidase